MKLKEIINKLANQEINDVEKLKTEISEACGDKWYIILLAYIQMIVQALEKGEKMDGATKKRIALEVFEPLWSAVVPAKVKAINALTCGMIKGIVSNILIDGTVWLYNAIYGKMWGKEETEDDTKGLMKKAE